MMITSTPQQIQESQWNRPMATRRESSLKKNEKRVLLGNKYIPGPNAVICGRGKACTSSAGNKKLRSYVDSFAKSYGTAANKEQKSKIVSTIISLIEEPEGGAFVKFEESTWWKVDEAYAREKIGNLFRDVLHTKYRSSSKAKQARKQKTGSSSSSTTSSSSSSDASVVTPVKSRSSMDESMSTSLSSTATAPTLNMDMSYSSTSSAGSAMGAMCGWNNNSNMGLHMRMVPSSFSFMNTMASQMNLPCSQSSFFANNNNYNGASLNRRNMLLNYCNEAINITCDSSHMSAYPVMPMSSHIIQETSIAGLPPYSEEDEDDEEVSLKDVPSTVSNSCNDDEDSKSIATFADDDIFNEFLVDTVEDLSGVF
jgi:hypothetical protein